MQRIYKSAPQGELTLHIFQPDTDEQTAAIVFFLAAAGPGAIRNSFFRIANTSRARDARGPRRNTASKANHGTLAL